MGFRMKMFVGLFIDNNICFHLPPTSSHFHPLQVEKCDSNSRLVVNGDDNGKLRLEKVEFKIIVCERKAVINITDHINCCEACPCYFAHLKV